MWCSDCFYTLFCVTLKKTGDVCGSYFERREEKRLLADFTWSVDSVTYEARQGVISSDSEDRSRRARVSEHPIIRSSEINIIVLENLEDDDKSRDITKLLRTLLEKNRGLILCEILPYVSMITGVHFNEQNTGVITISSSGKLSSFSIHSKIE